jgi:hypothetical protein
MKACPHCGSKRIAHFRLDSDWGTAGDWTAENTTSYQPSADAGYTPQDLESFERNERPDIECDVCCACGTCFNS